MNLFWLFLLLLPVLAAGNCEVDFDVAISEVLTDDDDDEPSIGLKIYSTEAIKNNPFVFTLTAAEEKEQNAFLGTTLIREPRKDCFTLNEIALLRARQGFEWLVPKSYPKLMPNNSIAHTLVRYWNVINEIVYHMTDAHTERLVEDAFYDTLGAHLRYYLLPMSKVSYYAGRVSLDTVKHLVDIKRECHMVLRSNGYGWRLPTTINMTEQLDYIKLNPVTRKINESGLPDDGSNICDLLDFSQVSDSRQMSLLLPNMEPLDAYGRLTNIYLPFREQRIYNLRAPGSAFELKRFLNTMEACQSFLKIDPNQYNRKLLNWIHQFAPHHLLDEQFYPGLEGILQIQDNLIKSIQMEDNDREQSGKHGRSISLWKGAEGQDQKSFYMDERLYITASIVLAAVFVIVVCLLHCGRRCAKKKDELNQPLVTEDVEMGEIFTMAKPKRVKKEKKLKIDTQRSPMKITSDSRYYGHHGRSVTSEECSTSTLGYQFNKKIAPFHLKSLEIPLEKARKSYKYAPLTSQTTETSLSEKKKKKGHGKK